MNRTTYYKIIKDGEVFYIKRMPVKGRNSTHDWRCQITEEIYNTHKELYKENEYIKFIELDYNDVEKDIQRVVDREILYRSVM